MKKKVKNDEYVSCWTEKDAIGTDTVDAMVVILRTNGCAWAKESGCYMCGYANDSSSGVTSQDLISQMEKAMAGKKDQRMLKIFTSGSFFDDDEIFTEACNSILKTADEHFEKVIVESRPEFVTKEKLSSMPIPASKLEIAFGLESSDDTVRSRCLNKGFEFDQYRASAEITKEAGVGNKTYLLIKPPFLTEREAIEDAVRSAEACGEWADTISFNPVNIQNRTLVERLWKRGEYRAPWLWSVVEILKRSAESVDSRLVSAPTAGGVSRGAHNCGKCDKDVLKAIERFSLNQDPSVFNRLTCTCKKEWETLLNVQEFMGSTGDVERLIFG